MPRKNSKKEKNLIRIKAEESRKNKLQEKKKAVKENEEAIQKNIDDSWWRRKREQEVVGLSPLEESPERTPEELNDMLKNLNPQDRIRFVEAYKKDYNALRKMKNPSKGKLTSRINSIKPTLIAAMKHRLNPHSTSIGTIHDDGTFKFVENPSSGKSTKKKRKLSKNAIVRKKSQKSQKKKKKKKRKN